MRRSSPWRTGISPKRSVSRAHANSGRLPGRRVAIVHFTGPAAVGGIESLIQSQMECLEGWDIAVRLIVGGAGGSSGDMVVSAMMHPEAVAPYVKLLRAFPLPDHPIVTLLVDDLRAALEDCTDCWVHNAFTVFLNPYLTVALRLLAAERTDIRWVAWCEDISSTSAYWDGPGRGSSAASRSVPGVRYVTIAEVRRPELARVTGIPEKQITVIPPPVDALRFLGIGETARVMVTRIDIIGSMPVVLVPAKLLPHKNLSRCVAVARALQDLGARPLVLITAAPSPHEPERSRVLACQLREEARRGGVGESFYLLPDVAGELDHGTVRDLMLLSDVIFLPSLEEGYGLPIQEAMILRVPILCSRIPAFEESSAGPFFGADQTDNEVAGMILELAESPVNRARRAALQSRDRFRRQLAELLLNRRCRPL